MDTSIQVLSNTIIFVFIYWCSILGWYSQPYHKEWTIYIVVIPYKADMVNHAMNNKMTKITVAPYYADTVNHTMMNNQQRLLTIFAWHVQLTTSTTQMKAD